MAHRKPKHIGVVMSVFKYFEPIWTGRDGKISLRSLLAIFFSWKLIENFDYGVQKWDAGRDLGDLGTSLLTLAGLIAALLSITMYQNVQTDKINAEMESPKSPPITVQKAESVTTDNIENVNTGSVKVTATEGG